MMSADEPIFVVADVAQILSLAKFLPVFPCSPATKAPLTGGGFKDATKDPDQIRRWWTQHPSALVGVPMGSPSGLVCIDYDSYKSDSLSDDWIRVHSDLFMTARVHLTRRGGKHYIFRSGEGARITNSAGIVLDGRKRPAIDVRGDGGYIIWWPLHGGGIVNDKAPFLPDALLEQLLDKSRDRPQPPDIGNDEVLAAFVRADLYKRQIAPGKHAVSCPWESDHTSESSESATVVFQPHWNGYTAHGFKCQHAHCSDRTMFDVCERLEIAPKAQPTPEEPVPAGTPRLIELGFTVNESRVHLDLPYCVKNIFDRGQLIVMWGRPGSGKTFLACHMACHIGAGMPWVGRRVKQGKVLYVCAESTRARLENRVSLIKQKHPELAASEVIFVPISVDLLHGEQDIQDVIAAAKAMQNIALIVIDTLSVTMGGGNENGPEDMGLYVANVKRIKAETGAAVMVVHHGGKDEARGMRGHSSLIGAVDAELSIEQIEAADGQPSRICRSGKLREGDSNADLFSFELQSTSLGVDTEGDLVTSCVVVPSEIKPGARKRSPNGTQGKLLRSLEQSFERGAVVWTDRELRDIARFIMSRNSITQAIVGLTQSGFLKPSVGGFVLTYPPEA